MQQAFMCDHCPDFDRKVLTREEAIEHEKVCIWNPQNKSCWTCKYDGMIPCRVSDEYGQSWMTTTRGCIADHRPAESNMIRQGCQFHEEESVDI